MECFSHCLGLRATLQFSGAASVSEYESLLLSLAYLNNASEPTSGNRSIIITLSDGIHQDMTAVIVIVILRNDNLLRLTFSTQTLTFNEGDTAINIGILSGVTLMDEDRDSTIESISISLNGSLETAESIVVETSPVLPSGGLISSALIEITQSSSLQNYQVRRE